MIPSLSVITPASRGVKHLEHLLRDFKNQTLPKNLWEHIIVWDGKVPLDVQKFMDEHKNDYNIRFTSVDKDLGDMKIAPGTRPRNHGIKMAQGHFCVFFDDDDRALDKYCETLVSGTPENAISVVQMSCSENRMYRNGNPNRVVLIPEIGLTEFPIPCHMGTPCTMIPTKWALEDPWRHEPEHDFRFIYRIVQKHRPTVYMHYGMYVDVDSAVIGNLKDWVSIPPFYRG